MTVEDLFALNPAAHYALWGALAFRAVDRSVGLHQKWGISEREFLGRIFASVDVRGTKLPPTPPEGPPKGTYFSRRKATAPSPPLPAVT